MKSLEETGRYERRKESDSSAYQIRLRAEHLSMAWAVASEGDDAAIAPKRVSLRAGAEASVTLTLTPSFRVRGEVTDMGGLRISTATVRMIVPDIVATGTSSVGAHGWVLDPVTCVNGEFEFAGVLPRTPPADEMQAWATPKGFDIEAHADGFLGTRARVEAETLAAGATVTVALVRTGIVRGRCTGGGGRGVGGVVIKRAVVVEETFQRHKWTVTTDEGGWFAFEEFPEVGGTLEVARGEFASRTFVVPRFAASAGHDVGEISLDPGTTARGRVVTPDGDPVPGASIWFGDAEGTTDSAGRFVVVRMNPGPWRVYVQDDIGKRKARLHVTDISSDLTIVAASDRYVRLSILFAPGAEPPDDPPYVHITWRRQNEPADTRRNERWRRGRYDVWIQPEQSGRWIFRVVMPGYEPSEVTADVQEGRSIAVSVTLRKAAK
jgi:hypothetical protein